MTKQVLSVGQCGFDHGAISRFVQSTCAAHVTAAETTDEALDLLRRSRYDLVLVNRVLDADGSPGVELIRQMQADADLQSVPVMLVTNYPDHQQQAVALGAAYGFGKSELGTAEAAARLKEYL